MTNTTNKKTAAAGPPRTNKYVKDGGRRAGVLLAAAGAVVLLLGGYLFLAGPDASSAGSVRPPARASVSAPEAPAQPEASAGRAPAADAEQPSGESGESPRQPKLAALSPGPFQRICDWKIGLEAVTATVQKGESLSVVMERLGFDAGQAHRVFESMSEVMDLRRVRPGAELTLYRRKDNRRHERLEFGRGNKPRLVMINTPAGWAASWQEDRPVSCLAAVEGRIEASLWGSAVQHYGLSPSLVLDFTDIFAYDVDFFTDIRKGDRFALLFEEHYRNGEPVGAGRILAASFENGGRRMEAFYYRNSEGKDGYYDGKGRSLKKMFLKSPLQYRRISSHFSYSRMHPILKTRRPHLGVDYAAPTGTPIEALGNGRIKFIGRKGGYGKFIHLDHPQGYESMYGHLSGFAKGLKRGERVKQGQLIGYVGSTGLSTGPHLDFRLKKNNKFIDPLSLKSEPAPPIKSAEKGDFLAVVAERRSVMNRLMASRGEVGE